MAYDITLEGENLIEAEKLLSDVITLFESCNITYWLEGGTLLGIRRENRLLPWDNDLDISIHESERSKLEALQQTLKKNGFRVRTREFKVNTDVFKKGELRMIKIRTKRFFGLMKGKVCLDIFVKYQFENKTYWGVADTFMSVPSKYYTSFKSINFKGKNYSVPKQTDEYLTYRYGDWQTPIKVWNTFEDDGAL